MPALNAVTPAQLARLIGLPDAPVILNVRIPGNTAEDPALITGSRLHPQTDITAFAPTRTGKRVTVTCKRGRKLSHGAAARFLFVTPSEVPDLFHATPFGIEGVHFGNRAEGCIFNAMPGDFPLHTDALDRLAQIVRSADTDRRHYTSRTAGLLAKAVGLSRLFRDNLQLYRAGMAL